MYFVEHARIDVHIPPTAQILQIKGRTLSSGMFEFQQNGAVQTVERNDKIKLSIQC